MMLWTWLNTKPLPFPNTETSSFTFLARSAGPLGARMRCVSHPPPQNVIRSPNLLLSSRGYMFAAEICTGFSTSIPDSIKSGIKGLIEPQQRRNTLMSLCACTASQNLL